MTESELAILLGQKVRELRTLKKLSITDLAYECGFEKSNLIRIEKGRTLPTTKTLLKISLALDVELKTLFNF